MPYPSPVTYPSSALYPGFGSAGGGRQVSLAAGLVLGAVDEFGVKWGLSKLDGWGSPAPTLELVKRPRQHGSTAGESFLTSRVMTLEGTVKAPSLAALDDAFDRLAAAVPLAGFTMLVAEAERVRHCVVRRSGEVLTEYITDTLGKYSVIVTAPDPRKLGDLVTSTTRLPSSTGGLVRPSTWPRTWTGNLVTGRVTIDNPGNETAPLWLRIDGPIPAGGWSVSHAGRGSELVFASSLALGAGEYITVDMERREVLAQGQSARSGWVTSRGWFGLDPGENTIGFSSLNYSPSALLTVSTMPAWA